MFMQAHGEVAVSTTLHLPRAWDADYSILKQTNLENFFHHISNLHQNINFTMEEKTNEELAFLKTLLKQATEKISLLVCRKPSSRPIPAMQLSPLSNLEKIQHTAYSIITNENDLKKSLE